MLRFIHLLLLGVGTSVVTADTSRASLIHGGSNLTGGGKRPSLRRTLGLLSLKVRGSNVWASSVCRGDATASWLKQILLQYQVRQTFQQEPDDSTARSNASVGSLASGGERL